MLIKFNSNQHGNLMNIKVRFKYFPIFIHFHILTAIFFIIWESWILVGPWLKSSNDDKIKSYSQLLNSHDNNWMKTNENNCVKSITIGMNLIFLHDKIMIMMKYFNWVSLEEIFKMLKASQNTSSGRFSQKWMKQYKLCALFFVYLQKLKISTCHIKLKPSIWNCWWG